MHYVARWRMHLAMAWLKEDDSPLCDLASRRGYESEAAFGRAFKRFIGTSPGAVRRGSQLSQNPEFRSQNSEVSRHEVLSEFGHPEII